MAFDATSTTPSGFAPGRVAASSSCIWPMGDLLVPIVPYCPWINLTSLPGSIPDAAASFAARSANFAFSPAPTRRLDLASRLGSNCSTAPVFPASKRLNTPARSRASIPAHPGAASIMARLPGSAASHAAYISARTLGSTGTLLVVGKSSGADGPTTVGDSDSSCGLLDLGLLVPK